jgi:hypothetical protein
MRGWSALLWGLCVLVQPSAASALSQFIDAPLWTENRGVIPICFDGGMATLPDVKRRIVSALRNSWQKYLNIVFTEFDTCTFDPVQRRVRVLVKETRDGKWHAQTRGLGMQTMKSGAVMDCSGSAEEIEKCRWSMSIAVPFTRFSVNRALGQWKDSAEAALRYQVVHEFGHVLGFVHEQDTARNWRLVLRPNPQGVPVPEPVEEIYCRPANHRDSWKYRVLTPGFDIKSIMIQGYCGGGHRESPNQPWQPGRISSTGILTPTDISAAQALYGKPVDRVRQRVP